MNEIRTQTEKWKRRKKVNIHMEWKPFSSILRGAWKKTSVSRDGSERRRGGKVLYPNNNDKGGLDVNHHPLIGHEFSKITLSKVKCALFSLKMTCDFERWIPCLNSAPENQGGVLRGLEKLSHLYFYDATTHKKGEESRNVTTDKSGQEEHPIFLFSRG